eukprot:GEMP01046317.1.p1 GENE.GEMP01046317.1~~GEMP01046317.1.p1  ORF type:complete len:314 (+),score=96.77 GEMP01046317.1:46-987(+)
MAPRTILLATEKPFAASAVEGIEQVFEKAKYTLRKLEKYSTTEDLCKAIADVDAVIVRSDGVTKEVLDAATNLKIVVRAGAGVDTIDLPSCTDHKVVAMNTPGQNSNAVAELVFGMLVTNARNHYDGTSGYELKGKTIALYGFGQVARNVHRIAQGFGMKTIAYDPYLKKEDIESANATCATSVAELFTANFVSLHIPATEETKKSINYELLMKLPQNGVLVNTARKEVIDEEGMYKAFAERPDLAYVSDVMPSTPFDHVNEKKRRIFVTAKKMGAQTVEANNNAGVAAAEQIVAFFEKNDVQFQVNKPGQTF